MPILPGAVFRVTAGHAKACAGIWVRTRSNPRGILLPTVAHVLFNKIGSQRASVCVDGVEAKIVAAVPIGRNSQLSADAALLALPPETTRAAFFPGAGHLNRFYAGIPLLGLTRSGRIVEGRLVCEGWSGRLAYSFGGRRLERQWLVLTETGENRIRAGDSGAVWMTRDGIVAALQVGVLRERPEYAIVTPFETICRLFDVGIAG